MEGKQVWKSIFSFLISSCMFSYLKLLESNSCSQSFPPPWYTGTAAKAGRASDGTVPFCVLPSALPHSLTVKTWQHTQPSRSAVPHPGGPPSRTEKYTYETVYLRRGEQGKVLIMSSWHMFYITSSSIAWAFIIKLSQGWSADREEEFDLMKRNLWNREEKKVRKQGFGHQFLDRPAACDRRH